MCEICSKLTMETQDVVLMPLFLLTLIFYFCCLWTFEHVNAEWNTVESLYSGHISTKKMSSL